LKDKTPWDEFQVRKWGDLCGESDFGQNPHSNALTSLRRMEREITRVSWEWGGVDRSKNPWFYMLSLPVREIGLTAMTSDNPRIAWASRIARHRVLISKIPVSLLLLSVWHIGIAEQINCQETQIPVPESLLDGSDIR
jgi:hypothetical protein